MDKQNQVKNTEEPSFGEVKRIHPQPIPFESPTTPTIMIIGLSTLNRLFTDAVLSFVIDEERKRILEMENNPPAATNEDEPRCPYIGTEECRRSCNRNN